MKTIFLGDCFLVPDRFMRFGSNKKFHPWVVMDLDMPNQKVILSPISSKINGNKKKNFIYLDNSDLRGSSRPAVILQTIKRTIAYQELFRYRYLGNISNEVKIQGKGNAQRICSQISNPLLSSEVAKSLRNRLNSAKSITEFETKYKQEINKIKCMETIN